MKLGLWVTAHHPGADDLGQRFRELVEQVRLARDLGFGIVTSGQHYLTAPNQRLQTLPLLARLAAEAEGMEVGTSVLLLPLHNPIDIAEQVATLDVMTGGRFVLGLGLGNVDHEYAAFRVPKRQRPSRFEEALHVMKLLWAGGEVEFQGRYFTVPRVVSMVRPVQRPHPRIWIGGGSEAAIRRAARLGHAWFPGGGPPARLAGQLAVYRQALAEYGNAQPADVPVSAWVCLAEEREQAQREARHYYGPDAGQAIVGTPADCVQRMQEMRSTLGATHVICRIQQPGMPQQAVLRTIRLLGEGVAPRLS